MAISPITTRGMSYKECPDLVKVDRISAGESTDLDVTVTDNNGCLADFTVLGSDGEGTPAEPQYDEEGNLIPALPAETSLPQFWWGEYVAKPAYRCERHALRLPLDIIDTSKGQFRVRIRDRKIPPGVYIAEASFYAPGRVLKLRERRWLEVEPTLLFPNHGPVTEQEVRMALRDYACFNTFLQTEESYPSEIMFAIRRPVDLWNEMPPAGVAYHTVTSFPYRENWLEATIGYLLRSHAAHRRRNELTISNSTIQMRDNDKHETYEQLGAQRIGEYKEWVREAKRAINVQLGFGTLGSRYGRLYGGRL